MKIRKGLATATTLLALGLLGAAGGVAGASTSSMSTAPTTTSSQNVVQDCAETTPQLSTLVAAIKAAGLVHTLEGSGPFTVFAPTNRAFAALPKGTLKKLLEPANKGELVGILTYHVVPGTLKSSQIQPGTVKTVNGATFTVGTSQREGRHYRRPGRHGARHQSEHRRIPRRDPHHQRSAAASGSFVILTIARGCAACPVEDLTVEHRVVALGQMWPGSPKAMNMRWRSATGSTVR